MFLSVLLGLSAVAGSARGQSLWRYLGRPDVMIGIVRYEVSGTPTGSPDSFDTSLLEIGVGIGATLPIVKLGRDMSIAVIPGIAVAGVPATASTDNTDRFPLTMSFEAPLFAALKYGTDAVWYSDTQAGVGIGIGGWYGAFTTLDPVDITASYLLPAIMVEASVVISRRLFKIRYCRLFGESLHDIHDPSSDPVGRAAVTQQSIQLLFNPGY